MYCKKKYADLINNSNLVQRFLYLAKKNFTFVNSWDDQAITSSTIRVYSKQIPIAAATKSFIRKVIIKFENKREEVCIHNAEDTYKLIGLLQS